MDTDLDTFLTAAYTAIDTFYQLVIAPELPLHQGPAPHMHDVEVLTLVVVGQWRGSSERALLRWADAQLRAWFPVQLSQSAFNRRVHRLGPILTRLLVWLAIGFVNRRTDLTDFSTALMLNSQLRGPGLRQVLGALAKSAREEVDMRQRVMAQRSSRLNSGALSAFTATPMTSRSTSRCNTQRTTKAPARMMSARSALSPRISRRLRSEAPSTRSRMAVMSGSG